MRRVLLRLVGLLLVTRVVRRLLVLGILYILLLELRVGRKGRSLIESMGPLPLRFRTVLLREPSRQCRIVYVRLLIARRQ